MALQATAAVECGVSAIEGATVEHNGGSYELRSFQPAHGSTYGITSSSGNVTP
jgi:hypothetical protein